MLTIFQTKLFLQVQQAVNILYLQIILPFTVIGENMESVTQIEPDQHINVFLKHFFFNLDKNNQKHATYIYIYGLLCLFLTWQYSLQL